MSNITASLVRNLREKSGAGMMECKKALEATSGDLDAAFDELRKSGLKTAAKKAGRSTGEGRVWSTLSDDKQSGAMIAISCETDFVAKTPNFEEFLRDLANHVLEHNPKDLEECLGQPWKGDGTVDTALKALVGKLGENIQIASVCSYSTSGGAVQAYVHHDNKKGAIVQVSTDKPDMDVLRDLCMHIVVFNPGALDRSEIDESLVEREKAIIMEELSGKPAEIQEKIMVGRLEKFFAGQVVTEQPWVKDDKQSVQKVLEASMGDGTKLTGFSRFEVGA